MAFPGQGLIARVLIAVGVLLGGLGLYVSFTERGVANEIKGFVLLLVAAVLLVGGCVLWELRGLRRTLENKDQR